MDFTINGKIEILRNFVPVTQPQLDGNENAKPYVIWNLYNRVCEAVKSFVILLDNHRYYDAFVIAGHAFETCCMLSYTKDDNTENNYNRYFAGSAFKRLIALLETEANLEKEISWLAYVSVLRLFYPVGASIIKNTQSAKEKHEEVIKKINFRGNTNTEKINLLKNTYKPPYIAEYINIFLDNMGNIDDGEFNRYYKRYCDYKHSNMLAPGALAGDIDVENIDWLLNLVLGIRMYLDKSTSNNNLTHYFR